MYTNLSSRIIQFNGVVLTFIGIFLFLAALGISPLGIAISGKFLAVILGFEFIFSGVYLLVCGTYRSRAATKSGANNESTNNI